MLARRTVGPGQVWRSPTATDRASSSAGQQALNQRTADVIIAEIGVDMTVFPPANRRRDRRLSLKKLTARAALNVLFVREPECNGVIERFMRTLKEQCLYLHRFQSLAEECRIISASIARYNTEWLIERLGHQTPVAERAAAKAA